MDRPARNQETVDEEEEAGDRRAQIEAEFTAKFERQLETLNGLSGRPIYDALARVVFVTPGFLSFVRAVFPPVLCPILMLSSPPSLELLVSGIKSNWGANLGLLPSVVIQLLSGATDPRTTLARAFFDIALDSNHAIVYGLIDFNQTLPPALTSVLRSLLSVGELTILDDLVHMATHSVRHMVPVLTLHHREQVPSLFDSLLLSDLDMAAYTAVVNGIPFNSPPEWVLQVVHTTVETVGDSLFESSEHTMRSNTEGHLLQNADPLPTFHEIPDGLDIDTFLDEYLLNRGTRRSRTGRRDSLAALRTFVRPFTEGQIGNLARRVSIDRKREILLLTIVQDMTAIVGDIRNESHAIRENAERVFYYVYHRKFWAEQRRVNIDAIFAHPNLLFESIAAVTRSFGKSHTKFAPQLIYGFVTAEFDFAAFKQARPELIALDVRVAQALAEPDSITAADFPRTNVDNPNKFNKAAWMLDQIEKLKGRRDLLDIVKVACLESSPARKISEFQRGLREARNFFAKDFPPSMEMGEDEFTPIMIAYVTIANPLDLVSNFVFIAEFCGAAAISHLFEAMIIHPMVVLKAICNLTISEVDIKTLLKCECKWL
jgi:hypothetical protein